MTSNGKRRPPRPRIEIVSSAASDTEAAAIVVALEQFLVETAPAPEPPSPPASSWQAAALAEGVEARQPAARSWGTPSSWRLG